MTLDPNHPESIIRAVIKPGIPPDCSEVVAHEIVTKLQKAGYVIIPHTQWAPMTDLPDPGYCDDCGQPLSGPHCNSD